MIVKSLCLSFCSRCLIVFVVCFMLVDAAGENAKEQEYLL